ncbi:MAG: putative DNA modification/repair radical SAM protein [Rectinemataceae bacterium]
MSIETTFGILAAAARDDAAAPSWSLCERRDADLDMAAARAICHVQRLGGGSVPLLKMLLTNACSYHCKYCINRAGSNVPRASFKPEELARIIAQFAVRGLIQGAFISSGIAGSPDDSMEKLVWMAEILRKRWHYDGYLHLKVLPGSSPELIRRAMQYATRVSVNIELPTAESLAVIAPDKSPDAIMRPMETIAHVLQEQETLRADRLHGRKTDRSLQEHAEVFPDAGSGGQTTQLIVGASPESDAVILRLAQHLYHNFGVRRVYYSAFRAEDADPSLPRPPAPPVRREYRLYQADMLLRSYGFTAEELFAGAPPFLLEDLDPKTAWALSHPEWFPLELTTAEYGQLLRVPGIGPAGARKILAARRAGSLQAQTLKRAGVNLRRAQWFITIRGQALPWDLALLPSVPPAGFRTPVDALADTNLMQQLLSEHHQEEKAFRQPELDLGL